MDITVPMVSATGVPLSGRLIYDPVRNPLAIDLILSCITGEVFPLARQLVAEAYAHSPVLLGLGARVQMQIRDRQTTVIVLFPREAPAQMFYLSTQSLLTFVTGTRQLTEPCVEGVCEQAGCFECAWLRRQIPACSCGVVDCNSFRPVECPPEEDL
jgi:hypothetical protein